MKAEIITEHEKEFKPFSISITVETVQEARLMYHLFNHGNLKELIMKEECYFSGGTHSTDFVTEIDNEDCNMFEQIGDIIKSQGYEI